jgi:chaperonin cofactor prefoldin
MIRLSIEARRQVSVLLQQEQHLTVINIIRYDAGATILEAKQLLEEIERLGPDATMVH